MEIEELKCPICKEYYDEVSKIPRLLYECGHTLCQSCIFKLHNEFRKNNGDSHSQNDNATNNLQFKCSEDDTIYNITKIESFPKNIALIKLINKSRVKSNNVFSTEKISQPDIKKPEEENENFMIRSPTKTRLVNSNELMNYYNESSNNPLLNSRRSSMRKSNVGKFQQFYEDKEKDYSNNATRPPIKLCSIHPTRPLEIICIDHKIKICTNCALFGEHKNHNIVNEEDFMKEVEIKAEILIELFEMIEDNLALFKASDSETYIKFEKMQSKCNEKELNMIEQVNTFIDELIVNIKNNQTVVINKIKEKYSKIQNKITAIKEIPDDLFGKTQEWKNNIQGKLDTLNEINNFNEEYDKLIDIDITNQDLITTADDIINELVKVKNFPVDNIERLINENCLEINYEMANSLIKGVIGINFDENKHETEEILTLDGEDKKRLENSQLKNHRKRKSSSKVMANNSSNFTGVSDGYSPNNNKIHRGSKKNVSMTKTPSSVSNDDTFFNLDSDSTILTIKNSMIQNENKHIAKSPSVTTDITQLSDNVELKPNSSLNIYTSKVLSKNKQQSNSNHNSINTIKLSGVSALPKDKSKTPSDFGLDSSSVPQLKEKAEYIKTQFKNEIANFTGYELGEDGIKLISELLLTSNIKTNQNPFSKNTCKVKELKLTKTNLTDETVLPIIKALELNNTIININLGKNNLTDKSTEAIINLLNKNKFLKTLYFSNNNLSTLSKDKIKSYGSGGKIKIFI